MAESNYNFFSPKGRLIIEQGGKCAHCGQKKPLTIDHIIPQVAGGANTLENMQLLCKRCNVLKGSSPDRKRIGQIKVGEKVARIYVRWAKMHNVLDKQPLERVQPKVKSLKAVMRRQDESEQTGD